MQTLPVLFVCETGENLQTGIVFDTKCDNIENLGVS